MRENVLKQIDTNYKQISNEFYALKQIANYKF